MTYGRQQLLQQKQVTVISFIDLDIQIEDITLVQSKFDTSSVTVAQSEDSILLRCRSLL